METSKISFFIIRSFDDLVFTKESIIGMYSDPELEDTLDKIFPHRAKIKFESEFGGDGTEASVIYGRSAYSTEGKNGKFIDFEVWYSDEDEPRGYQTKEQINDEFLRRSLNIAML